VTTSPAGSAAPRPLTGLVRAMRPRQWTKNVLVLAPLLPAGDALADADLLGVLVTLVSFCLMSSGVYLVNDARDVEADREHPVKRFRPIAAGDLSARTAVVAAVLLFVVSLGLALAVDRDVLAVMAVYLGIQMAYCFGMKHEPVLELAAVASGFLLRALAGGLAAGLELSQWFLLTTAFGSLFMAAGKRYGEARMGELTGATVRRVVQRYTQAYLRFVWTAAATIVIMTYSLWSFEVSQAEGSLVSVISVVPFVLAIFRFAVDVDAGTAEEPDEIVLHDRVLLVLGVLWAVSLAAAVYL